MLAHIYLLSLINTAFFIHLLIYTKKYIFYNSIIKKNEDLKLNSSHKGNQTMSIKLHHSQL